MIRDGCVLAPGQGLPRRWRRRLRLLARTEPQTAAQLVLVFFDGEEALGENITLFDGVYGSRFYAAEWRTRDDRSKFGMVLDMIVHKNLRLGAGE